MQTTHGPAFATPALPHQRHTLKQTQQQQATHCVMKIEQLRTMAHGHIRDLERAQKAIKTLLLSLVDCRRALIQYRQRGFVQNETDERHALLLTQTQQIFPVVDGVERVPVGAEK
jgi:hypothetical protein